MARAGIATGFIISISKLLGNYNAQSSRIKCLVIISISKLLGNYNSLCVRVAYDE